MSDQNDPGTVFAVTGPPMEHRTPTECGKGIAAFIRERLPEKGSPARRAFLAFAKAAETRGAYLINSDVRDGFTFLTIKLMGEEAVHKFQIGARGT